MVFYSAKDIVSITGLSVSSANRIIQDINKRLREQGYLTIRGKVLKSAFENAFGNITKDIE
ncbi:MAG: hypothetical protein FD141_344 [Fusobacteria bacterium]|nr:MAG: hypothetical protein FD141_344 [Fusobacteriota bacterium]KAF0228991.1 MAG: hypothetical protein FD182_1247 [Fusobacteriota bacterium]